MPDVYEAPELEIDEDSQVPHVNFGGRRLDSCHFVEPFKDKSVPELLASSVFRKVFNTVRANLFDDEWWINNGKHGFEQEYGECGISFLKAALDRNPELQVAFFGSGYGNAIRDVFEFPGAQRVNVHEFCFTARHLGQNVALVPYLESGRLVVHEGPFEFIPNPLDEVDLMFSRFGTFYHADPEILVALVYKAIAGLKIDGSAIFHLAYRPRIFERFAVNESFASDITGTFVRPFLHMRRIS